MRKRIGAMVIAVVTFLAGAPLWVSIVLPAIYVFVAASGEHKKTEENYDQFKGHLVGISIISFAMARRLGPQLLWMALAG